ncbi:MAG: CBS domain-containing protein [Elusimicrobia bacterium]|nr:CBS domain-containing protein [Elusimicrobiota bacterium]
MVARDVMRKAVLTARPDMTVRELAQFFTEHHITGAPVTEENGVLLGVVSQTDLVRHELEIGPPEPDRAPAFYHESERPIPRGFHFETPDLTRVREVMTPAVISADEEMPLRELARLMQRKRVHRVIITRRGALRGIVTSMDLLRVLSRLLEREHA